MRHKKEEKQNLTSMPTNKILSLLEKYIESILRKGVVDQGSLISSPVYIKILEELKVRDEMHNSNVLVQAVEDDRFLSLQYLIKSGFDINKARGGGYLNNCYDTPIYVAATKFDCIALRQILHLKSSSIAINDHAGLLGTALNAAIYSSNICAVDILLKEGASPNIKRDHLKVDKETGKKRIDAYKKEWPSLIYALEIEDNRYEILDLLIKSGGSISQTIDIYVNHLKQSLEGKTDIKDKDIKVLDNICELLNLALKFKKNIKKSVISELVSTLDDFELSKERSDFQDILEKTQLIRKSIDNLSCLSEVTLQPFSMLRSVKS